MCAAGRSATWASAVTGEAVRGGLMPSRWAQRCRMIGLSTVTISGSGTHSVMPAEPGLRCVSVPTRTRQDSPSGMPMRTPLTGCASAGYAGKLAQLTSHEPNDAIDELTTAARESSMPAVVLQQQREPQRSRTPLSRQQLPILIQQGPELDQLINVNLGWLHARQSLPDPTMSGPLRLVTAPLPAPRVGLVASRFCRFGVSGPATARVDRAP